jgi:dimeric dUTPase (all-alpha-NTP-PPase superfamily)
VTSPYLRHAKELQHEMGYSFPLEGRGLAEYWRTHALAAVAEVCEALAETDWKPWRGRSTPMDRALVAEELVDAHKFLCNLMVSIGMTDEELEQLDLEKTRVVRQRLRDKV